MKISVLSLGCKVSQYEGGAIKEELLKMGYDATTDFVLADYYILNTCAVTNEAEHKSRSYLTKILNKNENAKIFVCGCASEHSLEQFLKNPAVIYASGNAKKNNIPLVLDNYIKLNQLECNQYKKLNLEYNNFKCYTLSRTRAYLKIQDGCNNFCSYCLIPFVRGRSRSRELSDIVKEATYLSKFNKEIVLTGINMSDYRINGELALDKVMLALSNLDCRIRISSLEVNIITEDLLKVLKSMPNFCPQFHLSMQSGCTRILNLMNRHYTAQEYIDKVNLIRKYFDNVTITTDVIVGFPTETEQDFLQTIDTIKKAKFFKMHIFPYSLRAGTKASRMPQINGLIKKQRVKELEKLDNILHTEYLYSVKDKIQTALIEAENEDYAYGYTETYVKVYVDKSVKKGELIKVKLSKIYKDGMLAEILS